jgi:hypothetical protein
VKKYKLPSVKGSMEIKTETLTEIMPKGERRRDPLR